MLSKLRKWIVEHRILAISIMITIVAEGLLLNNFATSTPQSSGLSEFLRVNTGWLTIVLGIPSTYIALWSTVAKTNEETKNLITQRELTVAQTLDTYNQRLSAELLAQDDRNTKTFASMQVQIDLRDKRVEELGSEKKLSDDRITELNVKISQQDTEISSLKEARTKQDAQMLELQNNWAAERKERLRLVGELENLKAFSEETVAVNKKLAARVKVLEDYILDKDLALPTNGGS